MFEVREGGSTFEARTRITKRRVIGTGGGRLGDLRPTPDLGPKPS